MKKISSKKGFTLMEMLIVVAIIAILIAIAIPTFTSALQRSRKAADEANLRAAYAEATVEAMTTNDSGSADTAAMQSAANTVLTVQGNTSGTYTVTAKGEQVTVSVDADCVATYTKK